MKKTLNIFLIAALLIPFTFSPASAGPRNNHLLEAVIIGTGVAILSSALIHEVRQNHRKEYYAYINHKRLKHPEWQKPHPISPSKYLAFNRYNPNGHWVIEKVWIAPIYENRWVPGYYKRQRRWIRGRYEQIIARKGYWAKRWVWIQSVR